MPRVGEIDDDEGQRLVRIIGRGSGSVACLPSPAWAGQTRRLLPPGQAASAMTECRLSCGLRPWMPTTIREIP
jgi:hypothetical protein